MYTTHHRLPCEEGERKKTGENVWCARWQLLQWLRVLTSEPVNQPQCPSPLAMDIFVCLFVFVAF